MTDLNKEREFVRKCPELILALKPVTKYSSRMVEGAAIRVLYLADSSIWLKFICYGFIGSKHGVRYIATECKRVWSPLQGRRQGMAMPTFYWLDIYKNFSSYSFLSKMSNKGPYTLTEDNTILEGIIKTKSYYILRGNRFWIDMEASGMIDRSWQSMKQRFEKYILPNIEQKSYTIPISEKRRIGIAYMQTAKNFDPENDDDNMVHMSNTIA